MDIVISIVLIIILIAVLIIAGLLDKKEADKRVEFLSKLTEDQRHLIKSYKDSCKVSFKDLFKNKKSK